MSYLDALPDRYRLILCDIWGVIHDGVDLYPGATERLLQWKQERRSLILITNAPRTAEAVEQQLHLITVRVHSYGHRCALGLAPRPALELVVPSPIG